MVKLSKALTAILLLYLSIFPAGIQSSPSPSTWLVVPGQSVGPIKVSMSQEDVLSLIGQPQSRRQNVWAYEIPAKLRLEFDAGYVRIIVTWDPKARTADGIAIGTSESVVTQKMSIDEMPAEVHDGIWFRNRLLGLSILVQNGKVAAILVESPRRPQARPTQLPPRPAYCDRISYISELVVLQDGPFLDIYFILKDKDGYLIGADGVAYFSFNGERKIRRIVRCEDFQKFRRGRGAFESETFGHIMPRMTWADLGSIRSGFDANEATLVFWTTYGTFEKSERFTIR